MVIHAPDETSGPKDAKGRSVLKTQKVSDAKFKPLVAVGLGGVVLLTLLAAFLLRGSAIAGSIPIMAGGAILLGPLLAWAGYSFLRDLEAEPYRGSELWIRAAACGLGFALAWGAYALLGYQMTGGWPIEKLEIFQVLIAAGVAVGIGTFASFVSLDLEPLNGGINFALYFGVTVLLRVLMGLAALPGMTG